VQVWGLGVGLTTPPRKNLLLGNHGRGQDPLTVAGPLKKKKKNYGTINSLQSLLSFISVLTLLRIKNYILKYATQTEQ
jgi:hypothetical protein